MKDYGLYLVLMFAGLGTAYWASLPVDDASEDKQPIFSIDPSALASISYTAENLKVNVKKHSSGTRFWIDYEKSSLPPKAKAPDPKKTSKEEPKLETKKQGFIASDKMDSILDGMNPFYALRVIGTKFDDEQLKEYGLESSNEVVVITDSKGASHSFTLGSKSYGSRNKFVREKSSGKIMLIDGRPFENLSRANYRLYERKLFGFELDDVSKATLGAGSLKKVLTHTIRNSKGELQWADDVKGAKPKTTYTSWMNKIGRLRLTSFADVEKSNQLKSLRPFLTLSFERKGTELGYLQFVKQPGDKPTYWVRSKFLGTFAEISSNRIGPIEKDIDSILGK